MHLLQLQDDSSFRLVYRVNQQIPPYAILSHTWGANQDEVTFQDLTNGTGTTKAGFRKINFCAKQAALNGLKFFWIDTCCIDKSSSTELLEAINSMFRWYQESAKCFVYLDDVSSDSLAKDGQSFQKSRWFTRGWTLQELLAPKCIEFFSREGYQLGSRSSRVQEIADITRISIKALEGKALSHFSVDERMSWTNGRNTTRVEDMAYSLLGIFDIQMSLFYGEGREKAFRRLHKEIKNSQEGGEVGDVALRSDYFEFVSQVPTMLHETNDQFSLLMGDSTKDGPPDLIAVKRTGTRDENIEIDVLYGSSDYQRFILRIATPDFTPLRKNWTEQLDFTLTDWNGDGTLDLVVIKKSYTSSNGTEVHIFSGASKFQDILLQVGTKLEETDETWSFGMGRWGSGNKPDLFAIKRCDTGTKTTEVHVLCGDDHFQNFILQTGTGLHETDSKFDFIVTDWNGDGRPDLVVVKKSRTSGKCTEVHVLSGASRYKNFILRSETPLFRSNGLYEFAVADWTGNKKPDLIAFKKRDTGSDTTEIHIMSQQG
ncbi:HET-domain-containing protein [Didymella exigua CBS 183.55]|uniref:HET-domain-containing protein n=1 Tax=Didymella exigua CBS 183.55 TaxID=1150837 RepID=A0A6A5S066_9PLEO|nr:HET-domain-containing protein [Didymella exigua CBS 183.55]KAF1932668.1 HET-domain-containing protein [Didymella exigua CBS 183.55]